jgi:Predicted periplasmic lipoprotein (DUF2279)
VSRPVTSGLRAERCRSVLWLLVYALLHFGLAAGASGQQFHLLRAADPATVGDFDKMSPWNEPADRALSLDLERAVEADPATTSDAPAPQRCVLIQCRKLPIEPSTKLFNEGSSLWTAAGVLVGIIDGMMGPIDYGIHSFSFTDERYFQYTTYGGGSDKASHAVISANVASLLYDAYRLNGLAEDQAFALSLGTTILAGTMVEIGDGLTPYGFSAQDLTADSVGALASALVSRNHLDDLIGFQFGKVPTTIPAAVIGGRPLFGIDYSQEIYSVDMKLGGLTCRFGAPPGPERFFQLSFVFFTKAFGYVPAIESRYQEVGLELGLNFPEILKAVGVSDATWWGNTLLRVFKFFRIPYTQIGTYYNLKNHKWYGPGAPYQFY